MNKTWMIYGATGYTGRLIVAEAHKRGLTPIIAGRNDNKLNAMAQEFNLDYRCFDLSSRVVIAKELEHIDIVLHCAGPFSATSKPMMSACIHSKSHYLDITGEISVFQHAKQLDKSAKDAGIIICCGVGFDVIPTDCLAASLKQQLPDATSLWLGFSSNSGFSPGTAKTSIEGLAGGGKIRRNGRIITVPLAYKVRTIDFGDSEQCATTIPWGDVATAYYSTGIPNIEVYIPMPEKKIKQIKRMDRFRSVFAWKWLQNYLKNKVEKSVRGPSEKKREGTPSYIWGEVINDSGKVVTGRLVTANGYALTVTGSLGVVDFLLSDSFLSKKETVTGFQTASALMGADYVTSLPGSGEIVFS